MIEYNLGKLVEITDGWRAQGYRIATCNGCFDPIHPGHISFIKIANGGDPMTKLLVSVNDDKYIRKWKDRMPSLDQESRCMVVNALSDVSLVTLQVEDNPSYIIRKVRPDIHYVGEEYKDRVVEMPAIHDVGATLGIVPKVYDYSSSEVLPFYKDKYITIVKNSNGIFISENTDIPALIVPKYNDKYIMVGHYDIKMKIGVLSLPFSNGNRGQIHNHTHIHDNVMHQYMIAPGIMRYRTSRKLNELSCSIDNISLHSITDVAEYIMHISYGDTISYMDYNRVNGRCIMVDQMDMGLLTCGESIVIGDNEYILDPNLIEYINI